MAGLEHKSEIGFRAGLPALTLLIAILLMQLQYGLTFLDNLFPFLSLAVVYYWCIFKPHLVPASMLFLLGLLQDILGGGPLGMTALLLILVRIFVIRQGMRFLEREFLFSWLVFIIVAFGYGMASWVVASFYVGGMQNFWTMLGQSLLTIVVYPAMVWCLRWVRAFLVTESR